MSRLLATSHSSSTPWMFSKRSSCRISFSPLVSSSTSPRRGSMRKLWGIHLQLVLEDAHLLGLALVEVAHVVLDGAELPHDVEVDDPRLHVVVGDQPDALAVLELGNRPAHGRCLC